MKQTFLAQNIGIGPTGGEVYLRGPLVGIRDLSDLISKLLVFIIPLASIILFFVLISGGFDFLMSQGNPEKIKSGRAKITAGLIGFCILLFSYVFVRLISYFLKLDASSPF